MRCNRQELIVQCAAIFMTFMMTVSANDELMSLDQTMHEQVTRELKVNVETFFEMTKVVKENLIVQKDSLDVIKSDSTIDIERSDSNTEKMN